MLTLYDSTTSVCAIKVRLSLIEKNIEFTSQNIDLRSGDQFQPDYLKLNPNAVVPTLVDERFDQTKTVITESSVILQYLEDTNPGSALLPVSSIDRANMRLWLKRVDDIVHPAIGTLTHATVHRAAFLALDARARKARLAKIPDENRRQRFAAVYKDGLDATIVNKAVHAINALIKDMDTTLTSSRFLAGPEYSLADCAVTPYANRLFDLGLLSLWTESAPRAYSWFTNVKNRTNFGPAITNYLLPEDLAVFGSMDPTTASRVNRILEQR